MISAKWTYFFCRPIAVVDVGVQDMEPMTRALIAVPRSHGPGHLHPGVGAILFDGLHQASIFIGRPRPFGC